MTSCEPGSHLPSGADLSTEAQRCQLICPHEELENVVINLSQLPFYYPLGPPVKPSLGSVWLLVGSMDEAKGSVRFLLHPDPGEPGRMKSWRPPGGAWGTSTAPGRKWLNQDARCSSHPNTLTGWGHQMCGSTFPAKFFWGPVLLPFCSHSPNILLLIQTHCIPIHWSPNEEMQSYRLLHIRESIWMLPRKCPGSFCSKGSGLEGRAYGRCPLHPHHCLHLLGCREGCQTDCRGRDEGALCLYSTMMSKETRKKKWLKSGPMKHVNTDTKSLSFKLWIN